MTFTMNSSMYFILKISFFKEDLAVLETKN